MIVAAVVGVLLGPLLRAGIARYAATPRFGVVELVAALGLALVSWGLARASIWVLLAACWLVLWGVVLALVDVGVQRLPNPYTGAAAAGVFVLLAAELEPARLGRAVLCGLGAAAWYFLLAFVLPAGMGLGDVKLAFPLGLALGWWGGVVALFGIAAGFLLHGLLTLVLLVTRRIGRRGQLPHGPAMIIGAVTALALFGS
ncbi:prepilin peptidase [Cryptosporangium sp. NPDC048952]|uniref:prepilin peptidase n=1 Tax=Cryptosporangium sp. NPDC048952 TaxID=3363961 RepID=UPI003722D5E1